MCTPNAIAGAVNVLKTTVDAGKKALDIANELKNVELKEAILELKEANLTLREENIALKELLSQKQKYNMQFIDNQYWDVKDDGTKEGPYCVTCWDYDKTASRLLDGYLCGICHARLKKK